MNNSTTARPACDGYRHRLTWGWRRKLSTAQNARLILFSWACATCAGSGALAQSPLWFTPQASEVVSVAAGATIGPPAQFTSQSVTAVQTSPSDLILEVADAPDFGQAVVNRISDGAQTPPAQTPLLSTESMIGPLQGAERLFGRLYVSDDLRDVAEPARSGPRADAADSLWMPASYTWVSPVFHHQPLYFEQPNLERYGIGHARIIQPLISSVHFFGSIPLVPYKTLTHHPRERVYTLGQGRPGNCVQLQRGAILGTSSVGELARFWHPGSGYSATVKQ